MIWSRLGDVSNYVEPFAGSLTVLLARPHVPRIETANDKDCYLANFWRAVACDPQTVAAWADWPVNECDLHARHRWLCDRPGFREHLIADPDYYDAKVAGWWVWGVSQWIGSGWCMRPEWIGRGQGGRLAVSTPSTTVIRSCPPRWVFILPAGEPIYTLTTGARTWVMAMVYTRNART